MPNILIGIRNATAVYLSVDSIIIDERIYSSWRLGQEVHRIKITARSYQTDGFGSSML